MSEKIEPTEKTKELNAVEEVSNIDSEIVNEEIDKSFFYEEDHVENTVKDTPISRKMLRFHEIFGINSYKLYNFSFLDDETIIYAAGTTYQTYNSITGLRKIYFSRDGGGIGSIAINNRKSHFAVAEKGSYPNIYIYEYPSMKLYRILRGGTDRSYSNITFSRDDTKLASVGSSPDYNICVWDWMNQTLVLKSKAFSQEVFRVRFSQYSDSILSTSGLAHLRFWKIASTFTGLKLKGETGKFGQIELSDVTGFCIFPDGKVLCGCENGSLLLWEGNLIKVVIAQSEKESCHKGMINVVLRFNDKIITSGKDGYIKFWDFHTIDALEGDDLMRGYIKPLEQYQLYTDFDDDTSVGSRTPCDVLEIKIYNDFWMVHDGNGALFKYFQEENRQQRILGFNSGKISGICIAKKENACATIGFDGTIRLWDFVKKKNFYSRSFKGNGTCIDWLNLPMTKRNRYIAGGYSNGVMRVVFLKKDKIVLTKAFKVHNNPIIALKFSPDSEKLAVLSSKGEFFFFKVEFKGGEIDLIPYCFSPTNEVVNTIQWNSYSTHLLLSCKSGNIIELEAPIFEECETSESFLREDLNFRKYTIKMMLSQKPKKDMHSMAFMMDEEVEEVEVEWDPASIISCIYLDEEEDKFICSVEGNFLGKLYICQFGQERPIGHLNCERDRINFMKMSHDGKYFVYGTETGDLCIRPVDFMETFLNVKLHDQDIGKITGFGFNHTNEMMITTSEDGTINVQVIDYSFLEKVKDLRIQLKEEAKNRKATEEDSEQESEKEKTKRSKELHDDENFSDMEIGEEEERVEEEEAEEEELSSDEEEEVDLIVWPELEFPENIGVGIDDYFFAEDPETMDDSKDIIDDKVYSIQEEKLKAEEDNKKALAEVKKAEIRSEIADLRKRFNNLSENNQALEPYFKLGFDDFNIDPEYQKIVQHRAQDMINETTKELEFSIAKYEAITKKLKDFYINELEVDKFSVCGLKENVVVTSFKIKKKSDYYLERLKEIEEITHINEEEEKKDDVDHLEDSKKHDFIEEMYKSRQLENNEQMEKMSYLEFKKKQLKDEHANSSKGKGEKVEKFTREKMNKEKAKRNKIKDELKAKKSNQTESTDKNEEIKNAEKNYGDYKLKCNPDYEVQTNQRMGVLKQRKIIIMVEEFNNSAKMKFNETLMEYRDKKQFLFEKIKMTNERVRTINNELGVNEDLFEPKYKESIEFPQKIYEISEDFVEEEYNLRKEAEKRAKKGRFGGMGGDDEGEEGEGVEEAVEEKKVEEFKEISFKERKSKRKRETPLLEEEKAIKILRLETEKSGLMKEIENEIMTFDDQLDELADEKIKLEYEIKLISMKLISLYQELIILDAFEHRDNEYLEKLESQKKDMSELLSRKTTLIDNEKKENNELENYRLKLKEDETKYNEKISPTDKEMAKIVYEIYKIKRKAKDERNQQQDENDGMDGDIDLDEEEEISQRYTEEQKKIAMTLMSDQNGKLITDRYNSERARDQSQAKINKLKSEREDLQKQEEELKRKIKITKESINNLQKLKLEKVSELYVTFFLNLDQIRNLERVKDSKQGEYRFRLPDKLDGEKKPKKDDHRSILFSMTQLDTLKKNKENLIKDIELIQKKEAILKNEKNKLDKKNEILKEAEEEAAQERREIFHLKFGEEIDLDILDGLEPTEKLKTLKKEFTKEEKTAQKRVEAARRSMLKTKKQLLALKKKNTEIIKDITKLGNEQLNLNKILDSTNKNIFKDEKNDKRKDIHKFRNNLKEIIKLLVQQIEAVKNEIGIFKSKGAQIYQIVENSNQLENDYMD